MTTFAEARQFLLDHREDYAGAYAGFRWPEPAPFNWALDWFDRLGAAPESRDRTGAVDRRAGERRPRPGSRFARDGAALEPGGELAALARRGARRPRAPAARQRRCRSGR